MHYLASWHRLIDAAHAVSETSPIPGIAITIEVDQLAFELVTPGGESHERRSQVRVEKFCVSYSTDRGRRGYVGDYEESYKRSE
jgi:hypothetical protein